MGTRTLDGMGSGVLGKWFAEEDGKKLSLKKEGKQKS